jgi:hypothetical protein
VALDATADLAVRVAAPKGPQHASRSSEFTVGVANAGPNTARGAVVAIVANVPASGVLGVVGNGWSCGAVSSDATSSRWACTRAAFAMTNVFSDLRVTLNPKLAQPASTLVVAASVAADSSDPAASNNTATASVRIVGK